MIKIKKIFLGILLVSLTLPIMDAKAASQANTLAELRAELNSYIAKREAAKNKQNLTQNQINNNKNTIAANHTEIENNRKKIEEAIAQIAELDQEIQEMESKVQELLRADAISKGENVYLEYVFGAKDISDFIIRYSISEKIAAYNAETITDFESKIKENEKLKVDLANREAELNKQIESLESSIESLGNQYNSFVKEALSFDQEVKSTQEMINQYVAMGCKENEPFTSCANMKYDTGFIRPLTFGTRTSNFGYRINPLNGAKYDFHSGVDIGGNAEGTNVYSAANGMVGKIIYRSSCGGNQVSIYHIINGVQYTTTYMHLLTVNVKVGDYVSRNTVIGRVGGGYGTMSYDKCSTGAHLHFSLAKGWYGSTYVSYYTWIANLLDGGAPQYANIPPYGKYFFSRY